MHTDLINKIIADNKLNETLDLAIFQDKLLSSHFQNYPTVKNTYYYYFNKIYIAESTNDLKLLKSTCEEALEHFYNKPFRFTTGIHSFGSNLLNVLIKLKEYNEGREKFYDLLNNTIHGSNHWFVAINLYTYLCFRSKKYNEGLTWHTKAIKNRRLKLQPSVDQEKFKVFGIYYSYLKMINEITSPNSIQANKSPRIAKFLNEVPTLSKDYKGARVAILLIQISFQLLKKEHQNLISTVDGLKRYRRRYLRDKNSVRSNIFLQMVAKLIENDFDREKAIAKTKSLRARLANHPIESVNQPFGVEILPYEEHWNLLLANLD